MLISRLFKFIWKKFSKRENFEDKFQNLKEIDLYQNDLITEMFESDMKDTYW